MCTGAGNPLPYEEVRARTKEAELAASELFISRHHLYAAAHTVAMIYCSLNQKVTERQPKKRLSPLTSMSSLIDLLLWRREMLRPSNTQCVFRCVCVRESNYTSVCGHANCNQLCYKNLYHGTFFKEEAGIRSIQMLICLLLLFFLYACGF